MHKKARTMYSYCELPDVKIKNQFPDEQVLLLLRKHPITQIGWVTNTFILLLCVIASTYISQFFQLGIRVQILIYMLFLYTLLLYIVVQLTHWYFNVGIITNKRISDVDTYTHLRQEVSQTLLYKVSEVTSKQGGIFRSIFNYGDVYVKTEGTLEVTIEFLSVPVPATVVQLINNYVQHKH